MDGLSYDDLEREVGQGTVRPVYLLVGPEEFQRREAATLLREQLIPAELRPFNYSEFEAGRVPLRDVLQVLDTFPFMAPRRLVVVNSLESLPEEERPEMLAALDGAGGRSVLVLNAAELDRRTVFYRGLRAKAAVVDFPLLKGNAVERWAENHLRRSGFRLSSGAVRKVVSMVGTDLQTLAMELEKIVLYAGADKTVPDSAVEALVNASRQHTIFELTDAIGNRDRALALNLMARLVEDGERPAGIIAMVARHFRQLMIAKEVMQQSRDGRALAAALQVPDFIASKIAAQARGIELNKLREVYNRLAEADYRLRSTGVEPRYLLEQLVCII